MKKVIGWGLMAAPIVFIIACGVVQEGWMTMIGTVLIIGLAVGMMMLGFYLAE